MDKALDNRIITLKAFFCCHILHYPSSVLKTNELEGQYRVVSQTTSVFTTTQFLQLFVIPWCIASNQVTNVCRSELGLLLLGYGRFFIPTGGFAYNNATSFGAIRHFKGGRNVYDDLVSRPEVVQLIYHAEINMFYLIHCPRYMRRSIYTIYKIAHVC